MECGYAVQEMMVSPTHVSRRLISFEEHHPTLTSPDGTFSVSSTSLESQIQDCVIISWPSCQGRR